VSKKIKVCQHCGEDVEIRNPSGFCDHLYYPDYCEICQKVKPDERYMITEAK
jgi:hypothetical protein